jgi:hypothetical protein
MSYSSAGTKPLEIPIKNSAATVQTGLLAKELKTSAPIDRHVPACSVQRVSRNTLCRTLVNRGSLSTRTVLKSTIFFGQFWQELFYGNMSFEKKCIRADHCEGVLWNFHVNF